MGSSFTLFSSSHIVAVTVVIGLISFFLHLLQKVDPKKLRRNFHLLLAIGIVFRALAWKASPVLQNGFDLSQDLPFHLCAISQYLVAVYLIIPSQKLFDVLFYWVVGGTSLALVFPEIEANFPSSDFIGTFMSHGLTLFTMLYLIRIQRQKPLKGSSVTSFLWLNIYAFLIVLPLDVVTGGNYLYLLQVPSVEFDPIHLLPAWPWYLLVLDIFFFLLFRLLYQPFRLYGEQENVQALT